MVAEAGKIEIPENEKNVALGKSVTASSQENDNLARINWWMEREILLPDGPAQGEQERRVLCWILDGYLEGVNLFWESGKANSYSVLVSSDNSTWETATAMTHIRQIYESGQFRLR